MATIDLLPKVKYKTIGKMQLGSEVTNDSIVMQRKMDGVRLTIVKEDGEVTGYNKRREHVNIPGWLKSAFSVLPENPWMIDGELCDNSFYAFELFAAPGDRAINKTYLDRVMMLSALVGSMKNDKIKTPEMAVTQKEKVLLLAKLKIQGAEGVVFKWGGLLPSSNHLLMKYKFLSSVDGMVLRKYVDGKEAVEIGVLKDGEFVAIGKCKVSKAIQDTMTSHQVIEVRYRKVSKNMKLVEPVFIRKRSDKKFYQCLHNQLENVDIGFFASDSPEAASAMSDLLGMVTDNRDDEDETEQE